MASHALGLSHVPPVGRLVMTGGLLLAAVVGSALVAISNTAWFETANSFVGATGAEARGLLYSGWLVLLGAPIVLRRPAAFGFQLGDLRSHLRLRRRRARGIRGRHRPDPADHR